MDRNIITCELFKKRLAELCVQSGLTGLPRRARDQHILYKSMIFSLVKAKEYTEKEINKTLKSWLANVGSSMKNMDHVSLRRQLVELGYLKRNSDGSCYQVSIIGLSERMFEPGVEKIDPCEVVSKRKDFIEKKRQEYFEKLGT
jgi:hypothetical protein